MIATKPSFEPHSGDELPNSRRVYVAGKRHAALRVPMREISLAPTKAFDNRIEVNEPVRLYDCSGPWGDPEFKGSVQEGLPALRRDWILQRGDVEEYDGRTVEPKDNGYLSPQHATKASDAARAAPPGGTRSLSSGTPARASSPRKWSSSPSAKTRASSSSSPAWALRLHAMPWSISIPAPATRDVAPTTPSSLPSFSASLRASRPSSPPSLSATKWRLAAPLSRPISTIPSLSR